ncbi:MAG TPA: hypothetical protein VLL30_00200 [Reyranella sp.]|nr:hypothetical protein [Reyranella sp.]
MMLEVRDLHAFYGKSHILQGISLRVDQGARARSWYSCRSSPHGCTAADFMG